jgi:NADPH-dependent glutamate synthase beta subunit-like oxidoreductase
MQIGFYFDQTRCDGCFACAVACKDWHDIPAGPAKWMRISHYEEGRFPNLFVSYLASPCYHCAKAICSFVCPNEAITKRDEDGVVIVDRDKCRGEHACGIIAREAMGADFLYGEAEAPCQMGCPIHLHIPGYVALIAKGKFKEALELIRRKMPLPSVCGRVCLNPCETECRRQEVDQAIAIEALKRFVTDYVPEERPNPVPQWRKEKVAIVGSGPAGLAAAYDLVRMGYGVTIFEALPVAGGMLSVGIPEHRLPREVLKRDIDYIESLGVEIRTNTPIGAERGLDALFSQGYGAILLAIGAHQGQKLNIPGADLPGTMVGTSFMRSVNSGERVKVGQKVVVLGGGNVALDCARSARRLGATEVNVVCLESREDMPAEASEIEQAEDEGIHLHTSRTPGRILSEAGKVAGVECLSLTGLTFAPDGQPQFNVVKGSEHSILADTVIFAVGQAPDLTGLAGAGGIETSKLKTIAVNPENLMTSRRGVFSAGDAVHGATSTIDAIASGQKAAFFINRYLQGDVLRVKSQKAINIADIKVEIPAGMEKQERQPMPLLPVSERVSNFKEVTLGFNAEAAIKEAKRCLNCAGHLCKDVCPYEAPQFADEEKAKMQKCDLCLERWADNKKPICVEACPVRALDAGPLEELRAKYGDAKAAHGFVYSLVADPSIVNKPKRPPW